MVLSHDPLTIEIYGTVAVRLICFLIPALAFLAFDLALPRLSKNVKARGSTQLPGRLGRGKVVEVALVAVGNALLAVLVQAALEFLVTHGLHLRSMVKVTSSVPLPWTIVIELLKGFAVRGIASYLVHRYLFHTWNTTLKTWHLQWQHSVELPFSLIAAYDHPVNYLLRFWLPGFLPAYLFRWHVLTWHVFLVLTSLEELFVFSGYAVLPSTIVLAGMARRAEAHFDAARNSDRVGNFGQWGVMDFVLGTTCEDEDDIIDDLRSEASKHALQDRVEAAVAAAVDKIVSNPDPDQDQDQDRPESKGLRKRLTRGSKKSRDGGKSETSNEEDTNQPADDDDRGEERAAVEQAHSSAPRRSGRRRGASD